MAIKIFCDGCGCEGANNKFHYLCHVDDLAAEKHMNGYSDKDGNSVSGRSVSVDLCNKCYNAVVVAAVKVLKIMQL